MTMIYSTNLLELSEMSKKDSYLAFEFKFCDLGEPIKALYCCKFPAGMMQNSTSVVT